MAQAPSPGSAYAAAAPRAAPEDAAGGSSLKRKREGDRGAPAPGGGAPVVFGAARPGDDGGGSVGVKRTRVQQEEQPPPPQQEQQQEQQQQQQQPGAVVDHDAEDAAGPGLKRKREEPPASAPPAPAPPSPPAPVPAPVPAAATTSTTTAVAARKRYRIIKPRAAFSFWAKVKRREAKAELQTLATSRDKDKQLLEWWKLVSPEARAPWVAMSAEDRLRYADECAVATCVSDLLADTLGEPRDAPYGPRRASSSSGASPLSSSSSSSSSSSNDAAPRQRVGYSSATPLQSVAVAASAYPSLAAATGPAAAAPPPAAAAAAAAAAASSEAADAIHADLVGVLHAVLEASILLASDPPAGASSSSSSRSASSTTRGPSPFSGRPTTGITYALTVTRPGPLGLSLDGDYPAGGIFGYNRDRWAPVVAECSDAGGAAVGKGKRSVPGGLKPGDIITHIAGVRVVGLDTGMAGVAGLIKSSPRPLTITLHRPLRRLLATFAEAEEEARAARRKTSDMQRERAAALEKTQNLQDQVEALKAKNAALRTRARDSLLAQSGIRQQAVKDRAGLEAQVAAYQAQLKKQNLDTLRAMRGQAVAASTLPERNAGTKRDLEAARARLAQLEERLERRMREEARLRDALPKRFRKSIGKMLRARMELPAAALVASASGGRGGGGGGGGAGGGGGGVRTEVTLQVEGVPPHVFKELLGHRGTVVRDKKRRKTEAAAAAAAAGGGPDDGAEAAGSAGVDSKVRKTLSAQDVEQVLRVSTTREVLVHMGEGVPKRRFVIDVLDRGGVAVVVTYAARSQSLKLTCVCETNEVASAFAALGKNIRMH